MSSIWSDFERKNTYYSDGITRATDPFWTNTCRKCGYVFMSCVCNGECPVCRSCEADRRLGDMPYDQVIAERGKPKNQSLSEKIRINQSWSEFIRENQSSSEFIRENQSWSE